MTSWSATSASQVLEHERQYALEQRRVQVKPGLQRPPAAHAVEALVQLGVVVCYAAAQVVALGLQGRNIGRSQHQLRVEQARLMLPKYISDTPLYQHVNKVKAAWSKLHKLLKQQAAPE